MVSCLLCAICLYNILWILIMHIFYIIPQEILVIFHLYLVMYVFINLYIIVKWWMSQLDEENVLNFDKCGKGTRPCACWWSFFYGHYSSPCHLVLYYQIRINYWSSVGLVSERSVGISIFIYVHTLLHYILMINNIIKGQWCICIIQYIHIPIHMQKYRRILGSDNVTASCPSFRWKYPLF
jgi:hypothetical protein